ncbi:MAG: prepilin-type N-terminal cleavage/methylation domain-containing protein [Gemmatimonadetes bacterium]|nr:prepilin-type N-terminal cleavage/methylation domain-containing protein [Gemmatimonadota bacterium]
MLALRPQHTRRLGVTLIEVVIAIFVLSIGILSILSLFPTGYRLTKKSVDRSIAALAARHAEARIYARINNIKPPVPASEPLAAVAEARRTGVITTVSSSSLTCTILGGQSPNWTESLTDYYCVVTSGTADGHFYKITGNTANTLTFNSSIVKFNQGTETQHEPVRVGDTFAIIGIKGGYSPAPTTCYPDPFLGIATLKPITHVAKGADPENNETRTMPVATYGAPNQNRDLWRYSYGCVLSVPFPERPGTCRLDVFIYSGFPYRADSANYPDPSVANSIVIGHYVTYVPAGRGT